MARPLEEVIRVRDAELRIINEYIMQQFLAPLYMSIIEQTLPPQPDKIAWSQLWRDAMSMRMLFWMLMILCALGVIGGFTAYYGPYTHLYTGGFGLIVFVLLGLLGWKVFGRPVDDA